MNDQFSFFLPAELVEKAAKNGKPKTFQVSGIASTSEQDTDGEFLDPAGFDCSYLLQQGFFNYNHQGKTDPEAHIGEPQAAEVKPEGLHLSGFLYGDHPLVEKIVRQAARLKANGSTRRLGWSIEGKALERDPGNPRRILRTAITGCALTFTPKNPATFADVVKSLTGGSGEESLPMIEHADDDPLATDAEQPAAAGKPAAPPSVGEADSTPPPLRPELEAAFEAAHAAQVEKALAYDRIFNAYPGVALPIAKRIYGLAEAAQRQLDSPSQAATMAHTTPSIPSSAALDQAFALLDSVEKAVGTTTPDPTTNPAANPEVSFGEDDQSLDAQIYRSQLQVVELQKRKDAERSTAPGATIDSQELVKSITDELSATLTPRFASLSTVLRKVLAEVAGLKGALGDVEDRVEKISGQPAAGGPKSILKAVLSHLDTQPGSTDTRQRVSQRTQGGRQVLANTLWALGNCDSSTPDERFMNASMGVENGTPLAKSIVDELALRHNILVVD